MTADNDQNARDVLDRCYRSIVGQVETLRGVTNGTSGAKVWQVAAANRPQRWALRRWPTDDTAGDPAGGSASVPDAGKIRHIHAALAMAATRGIDFVPAPVRADSADSEMGDTCVSAAGAWWELAPWMPGEPDTPVVVEGKPQVNEASAQRLVVASQTLARFHRAVADLAPPADEITFPEPTSIRIRQMLLEGYEKFDWSMQARHAATQAEDRWAGIKLNMIGDVLTEAIPYARKVIAAVTHEVAPQQFIVGDARREHFLFTGDHVTGLVDFGAAQAYDTPVIDLARLLGEWAGNDPALWQAGMDAYGLDPVGRRLIHAIDATGVAIASCRWISWIAGGRPASLSRLEHLHRRLAHLGRFVPS